MSLEADKSLTSHSVDGRPSQGLHMTSLLFLTLLTVTLCFRM